MMTPNIFNRIFFRLHFIANKQRFVPKAEKHKVTDDVANLDYF